MAQSTRPQLASEPNIAALTSDEQITALETASAAACVFAPVSAHSTNLVAPSPSRAIMRHRAVVTAFSAAQKAA